MKKIKISISGMHCGSCAGNIESALKKVKGVSEVSVSAMTNKSIIQAEDSVKEEDLKAAIAKAGYKVEKVE
jgi:P-type Cu+ transporter